MAQPAPGQPDQRSLIEIAVDVHNDLGKLATGLVHAGAQPEPVQVIQHMGEIIGELVKSLGAGPVGGEAAQPAAHNAPPAQEQAAAAPPAAPPQGPMPGARPNGLHEATAQLQAALASKHAAAQRALAGNQ